LFTVAFMEWRPPTCQLICYACLTLDHGSDFALRRPLRLSAIALNVPRSAIVPLLLPHRLSGTVYPRTCGRRHHCQCSGVGWRPSSTDAHTALDTLCDWHVFFVTWPCSFLTLCHVKRNSFIIIIIIIIIDVTLIKSVAKIRVKHK